MMINVFSLSGLLIGITSLCMSILIWSKSIENRVNRIWAFFTFFVALWGFGGFYIGYITDPVAALNAWRTAHLGIIVIPALFLHFVYRFLGKTNDTPVIIAYCFSAFFVFVNISGKLITNVEWVFNSFYYDGRPPTNLYVLFVFLWLAAIIYSHIELLIALRGAVGTKRNQIKYFFLGTIVGYLGGITCFLPVFGVDIYPYGNLTVPLYPLIMTYAIVKYRLMDVKVVITRTGIFLIVFALVFLFPFWIGYRTQSWILSTLFMAIFATGGPIIHRLLQHKAENVLMAQQKRYQRALINAGRGMVREHDIKKLMKLIVRVVRFSVGVDFVCAFLLDKQNNCYKIASLRGNIVFPEQFTICDNHELVSLINKHKAVLTYEEILSNKNKPLGKEIHMIVPAFSTNKLLAFVVLGEKVDRSVYTQEDIDVFSILSHQASLAIENCMFVEETKESERRLFQAEKLASIGGMADGVAHQIKNRLNHFSIASGEAQYEIKDFVKAHEQLIQDNPDLKKTFDYLTNITESLVGNVKRTNSIIQGILNYARVEEKDTFFGVFTLTEIMNLSLELLKVKHEIAAIPVTYEFEGSEEIYGVKAQIMESVYNVLDNCYEAVNERYKYHISPEEAGKYQMRVHLKLYHTVNKTVIEVQDNGVGVKEEDKHKIFAPFFTTKSSYKSGSGIGMYVVKRMIEENHNGKISFESEHMKGTKIVIELPKKSG